MAIRGRCLTDVSIVHTLAWENSEMAWIVMGFEGTGKQWNAWQEREDLRGAESHRVQKRKPRNGKKFKQLTGSFVAKFVKESSTPTSLKKYFPGPNIWGSNCDDILRDAQKWFGGVRQLTGTKICLTGYSRGAYIAMCFAKYLEDEGINVDYMGLFDPVGIDASIQIGATKKISRNVKIVRIAYRSDKIGSRRTTMNKIGATYAGGGKTPRLECPGSHGALGGFPNGAGPGDRPRTGQGHPVDPNKFHPGKEWTAWWQSGNFISVGAIRCGVPVRRLVPADGARFCLPKSEWESVVSYEQPSKYDPNVRRPAY